MASCNNCETFITPDYVRVFGDNDGIVQGCPDCTTFSDLTDRRGT
jgi:hypothetical protein